MARRILLIGVLLIAAATNHADESSIDLEKVDRTIGKEPSYNSVPHYALLVFGKKAEQRVWLVTDGEDIAYIDRNGNGDLTEADERIEVDRKASDRIIIGNPGYSTALRIFELGDVMGINLRFRLWIRDPNYDASKDERYRESVEYRNFVTDMDTNKMVHGSLRREANGTEVQIPVLLTTNPTDAQVCHLRGPLNIQLRLRTHQHIEPWPKKTIFEVRIGTRCLPPSQWKYIGFDFSPLSTSEVPLDVHPTAEIEFPDSVNGKSKRQALVLDQRCCGDSFFATFTAPQGITSGSVRVVLSSLGWDDVDVPSAEFEVPINQERSVRSEVAYVMFRDPKLELKDAVNALRKAKIDVTIRGVTLLVDEEERLLNDQGNGSIIGIRLNRDAEVREIATGLAKDNASADSLSTCDACFEIGPFSPYRVEKIERVEQVLQELTAGFTYQTWDQRLNGPK